MGYQSVLAQSATGGPGSRPGWAPRPRVIRRPSTLSSLAVPMPGTYDLPRSRCAPVTTSCSATGRPASADDAATPSLIVATFDSGVTQGASLTVGFGSDADGVAYVADADATFQVDDRGDTATITVAGTARLLTAEGETPEVGSVVGGHHLHIHRHRRRGGPAIGSRLDRAHGPFTSSARPRVRRPRRVRCPAAAATTSTSCSVAARRSAVGRRRRRSLPVRCDSAATGSPRTATTVPA